MKKEYVKGAIAVCDRLLLEIEKAGPDLDVSSLAAMIVLMRAMYGELAGLKADELSGVSFDIISIDDVQPTQYESASSVKFPSNRKNKLPKA